MSIVLHAAAVVLPICADPVTDGMVAVQGSSVTDVGPRAELLRRHPGAAVRDWGGLLMPGLVNAHVHLQYTDFADLAESGLPFLEWIRLLTRRRREFDAAAWTSSARKGARLALTTGTTCVADVVTDACVLDALPDPPLAGISYLEAVGADGRSWASDRRERFLAALDAVPGRAIGVSPHTLFTLSGDVIRDCVRIARSRGLRLHPHLAETAAEHEYVLAGTGPLAAVDLGFQHELSRAGAGCSPTVHLDRLGGLGPDCHVAHGVHVDAADRALLRRRRTAVALCARSNGTLAVGPPPVAAYLTEGNAVAVGTDSLASVPSLDLLAELPVLRDLALRQGADPATLDRALVHAVTAGGAAAIGRTDVGALRPGARADLAAFDLLPAGADPYRAVVQAGAGRCIATVLAGRVVHERSPAAR